MPLNTQAKRASAINVASPWRSMWPAPDGTIGQGDRQTIAFLYGGLVDVTAMSSNTWQPEVGRDPDTWTPRPQNT